VLTLYPTAAFPPRTAVVCHPHPVVLDAAVQLAESAVLLEEGVEGGE
jgi:hypothetical protein